MRTLCVDQPQLGLGQGAFVLGLHLCLLSGCVTPPAANRASVSANVQARTGFTLAPPPPAGSVVMPNGASLADGLDEDEAVLIALWNNALLQELLNDLGIARADLVQAGLLPNPELIYFFHTPGKPYKYALELPIEAFWLRPVRLAAAERESARVSERLTQSALDLIRDVRQAYADMLLAKDRVRVSEDAVTLRGRIAELAAARFRAGDVSAQEAATARIDLLLAHQDIERIRYDVSLAEIRLRNLTGLGVDQTELTIDAPQPVLHMDLDAAALTGEATATRPDALAAQQAEAAAEERLRLSKVGWARLLGLLDATSGAKTGHEFGPAFRVTLPVFNANQGSIARAEAELERVRRQRVTVRDQIILDVHRAYLRYVQASAEMNVLERQVRPEVEAAIRRADAAYREGNAPYVVVLEATRQLLVNRLRRAELVAELRRSWADLQRSVGRRLDSPTVAPGAEAASSGKNGAGPPGSPRELPQ